MVKNLDLDQRTLVTKNSQPMTPQEKPNIILVVLDSARRDMFGCYGNREGLTPHIDAWAKEGVIGKYN